MDTGHWPRGERPCRLPCHFSYRRHTVASLLSSSSQIPRRRSSFPFHSPSPRRTPCPAWTSRITGASVLHFPGAVHEGNTSKASLAALLRVQLKLDPPDLLLPLCLTPRMLIKTVRGACVKLKPEFDQVYFKRDLQSHDNLALVGRLYPAEHPRRQTSLLSCGPQILYRSPKKPSRKA